MRRHYFAKTGVLVANWGMLALIAASFSACSMLSTGKDASSGGSTASQGSSTISGAGGTAGVTGGSSGGGTESEAEAAPTSSESAQNLRAVMEILEF